ncbi:MAG: hypothetical protein ACREVG_14375, partial [Burkholderiales bacterium]
MNLVAKSSILALLLATVAGCATPAPARMWDTALIPPGSSQQIRLRYLDQTGKEHTGAFVERAHVDQLREVVGRVSAVAAQRVDRIMISDQDQANASAGIEKSQAIIVVTVKMLSLIQN